PSSRFFLPAEPLRQFDDEPGLPLLDLGNRRLFGEPAGAIDLGNSHRAPRARRPLDLAEIAFDRRWVAVVLERPGEHELAARLLQRRKRDEVAVGMAIERHARLLGELAPRRRQRILAGIDLALGDRPGARVLLGP